MSKSITKADLARMLGVPYNYISIYYKVLRLAKEKGVDMSIEELAKKYKANEAPKGEVTADCDVFDGDSDIFSEEVDKINRACELREALDELDCYESEEAMQEAIDNLYSGEFY